MTPDTFIVVGLGNPGDRYNETRHNIGFAVVDLLCHSLLCHSAQTFATSFTSEGGGFPCEVDSSVSLEALKGAYASAGWVAKADSAVSSFRWSNWDVTLLKPLSYMNRSGEPLSAILRYKKLSVENVIVVHDEIDLPFGVVRIKKGGGEGGHNGLRSISRCCAGRDYLRIRVGVGKPSPSEQAFLGNEGIARWVLSRFTPDERGAAGELVAHSARAVLETISKGSGCAQNRFHR